LKVHFGLINIFLFSGEIEVAGRVVPLFWVKFKRDYNKKTHPKK